MRHHGSRFAFALVFLVACVAVYTVWAQVGPQAHLDLMPWHWKLICGIGLSGSITGLTVAAGERTRIWHAKTLIWLALCLAFIVVMAALTYHIHVTEPSEDEEEDSNSAPAHAVVRGLRHHS